MELNNFEECYLSEELIYKIGEVQKRVFISWNWLGKEFMDDLDE